MRAARRLALGLRPKALEEFGLAPALAHLAETEGSLHELPIEFSCDWKGRLHRDAEWALFRFAQAGLAVALESSRGPVALRLTGGRTRVALTVTARAGDADLPAPRPPGAIEERVRLLDGRVSASFSDGGELVLRADVPTQARLPEPMASVA